jgi:hypothetical protein
MGGGSDSAVPAGGGSQSDDGPSLLDLIMRRPRAAAQHGAAITATMVDEEELEDDKEFMPEGAGSLSDSPSSPEPEYPFKSSPKRKYKSPKKLNTGDGTRKCKECGVTSTPVWRCGPDGTRPAPPFSSSLSD